MDELIQSLYNNLIHVHFERLICPVKTARAVLDLKAPRPCHCCLAGVALVANHKDRIQYKLCLLVHKMFVGHAPDYTASLLTPASDVPSRSSLRSSSNCDLVVPRTSRKIGDRAFSVAAPRAWNRLPTDLKLLHLTASFKSKLKSFLLHAGYTGNTVNSGMRHCRGRVIRHCRYCYWKGLR